MTVHEIAQIELAVVLFVATAAPLMFAVRWLVRQRRWPALPTFCSALCLSLAAAAFALADGEPGKPVPPQVRQWMRLKREWVCWTHTIKSEWAEFCAAIRQGFINAQGYYGGTVTITNSIPRNVPPPRAMQLRARLLNNPQNQNFKAEPTKLQNNGDGTWTVEITSSREIDDAPTLMMYLHRKGASGIWWVEHTFSSFPTNTAPNTYSYTFAMPIDVEGHLVVADEVLLGGPGGLTVEGLALVDLDKGEIYEGINGDFIDGNGLPLQVRGGQFLIESTKSQSTGAPDPDPEPMMMGGRQTEDQPTLRGDGMSRDPVISTRPEPVKEPVRVEPPLKLAMPPLDGGAK